MTDNRPRLQSRLTLVGQRTAVGLSALQPESRHLLQSRSTMVDPTREEAQLQWSAPTERRQTVVTFEWNHWYVPGEPHQELVVFSHSVQPLPNEVNGNSTNSRKGR